MSYSKLHSSIVNSSLWTAPDSVRLLFITLLAMCDRDGYVYGSKAGLQRLANVAPTAIDPWQILTSPDPDSSDRLRNPENEGRRIEEVPGGFRLLNFEYYRGLRNDDERREQTRQAVARHRAKVSQGKPEKANESHGNPISEADTEPEAEAEREKDAPPEPPKGGRVRGPFVRPTMSECKEFFSSKGVTGMEYMKFYAFYDSKGWKVGRTPMKSWKAAAAGWMLRKDEQ